MVIEYIRFCIPEDEKARMFEQSLADVQRELQASHRCISYELARCRSEPEFYIFRIEWDSLEGHMKDWRQSREFRRVFASLQPYLEFMEELRYYMPTEILYP